MTFHLRHRVTFVVLSTTCLVSTATAQATAAARPAPAVVKAPLGAPPSDAIVLFGGKDVSELENAQFDMKEGRVVSPPGPLHWKVQDGALVVVQEVNGQRAAAIRSKRSFGDIQLHLEFRSPTPPTGEGEGRGNSGIFFMQRYELQILDSYENPQKHLEGMAGAVYAQRAPLVNPSRPPGEWQSYDVVFLAPRFTPSGEMSAPPRMTLFYNGVLVQNHVDVSNIPKGLADRFGPMPRTGKLPIWIQNHGNPVAFRNIWVRELNVPEP